LPNDTVKYVNQQLIVNGERINEWYTEGKTEDMNITLGTDEYFCLGDNREHSKDSRVYGAFTNKQIKSVLTSMRGK
jgi:signal peptidase I